MQHKTGLRGKLEVGLKRKAGQPHPQQREPDQHPSQGNECQQKALEAQHMDIRVSRKDRLSGLFRNAQVPGMRNPEE
jgi:hypothetical protein